MAGSRKQPSVFKAPPWFLVSISYVHRVCICTFRTRAVPIHEMETVVPNLATSLIFLSISARIELKQPKLVISYSFHISII
jgi:hypothetical protein